jgi:hypothetical protein
MESQKQDKSNWKQRFELEYPEIVNLKERLIPIERAISFGREYVRDEETKNFHQNKKDLLNKNTILQLILQHLEFEGLKKSRKLLEQETKKKYIELPDLNESRLVTLLRIILKDTETIWDLTIDDKFISSKQNMEQLHAHLMDLDLLEEEANNIEEVEDVNIWEETPFNIIYDKDGKSIKAASLNQLVLKMTETDEDYDPQLLPIFLHTYKTFTTPEKFMQKLIQRYKVPSKNPNNEKDEEWKASKRTMQIRVINVLRKWIGDHYSDFKNSNKLMKRLEDFISMIEQDNKILAKPLYTALNNAEKSLEKKIYQLPTPPEPKVSLKTIFLPNLDLLECEEEEIARQLTIIEFGIYSEIKSFELLNCAWSKSQLKHRSPNVLKMIERSTKVSLWIASLILKQEKIKKRVKVTQKIIKIAENLFYMNNFSTSFSILAGLNMTSIHRLKYTFSELPKNSQQTLLELNQKLSSDYSYKSYRNILATVNPPCIPYLGTYLTDLTFINENENLCKGLINFAKRRLMYDVMEKIQRYQLMPYNFTPIPQILMLLETKSLPIIEREEERQRLSLLYEPTNAERSVTFS